jgi:NADPH:quinone reductase-like Zn-dependent oxidoreductase
MKAWMVEHPGGPFQQREISRPTPGTRQVLVRIAAAGVNPLDTKIRAGAADHAAQPLPAVLCLDMAGTVEEVGTDSAAFRVGDEVFGMVGGVGGLQGTLAEFVCCDMDLPLTNQRLCRCDRQRLFRSA